jgi:hypothetical protein
VSLCVFFRAPLQLQGVDREPHCQDRLKLNLFFKPNVCILRRRKNSGKVLGLAAKLAAAMITRLPHDSWYAGTNQQWKKQLW